MSRSSHTPPDLSASRERLALEAHAARVQERIRSCAGCGLCCTEAYNTAQILPVEALRIAAHLLALPTPRRDELVRRLERTTQSKGLRLDSPAVPYTCPFLERDATCALPRTVKPTLCLSFNPIAADSCDQEPGRFFPAYDVERARNRRANLPSSPSPIPPAVLAALHRLREREGRPTEPAPRRSRKSRRTPPRD